MALLADQIECWGWEPPFWFAGAPRETWKAWEDLLPDLKRRISRAAVVSADNVCEYLFAGTDQEEWDYVHDFPCCAPPFPSFFLEMRRPSVIVSEATGLRTATTLPSAWGWLFESVDQGEIHSRAQEALAAGGPLAWLDRQLKSLEGVIDLPAIRRAAESADPKAAYTALGFHEQNYLQLARLRLDHEDGRADLTSELARLTAACRWLVTATLVVVKRGGGTIGGPLCYASLQVAPDGSLRDKPFLTVLGGHLPAFGAVGKEFLAGSGPLLFPALLAVSFMNCKNVTIHAHEAPALTHRQNKGRQGRPFVRYHTIDINPMRQVLRREGRSDELGVRRALHVCRGHFADYSEKGLFGKYFGRFWVPAHLRGSPHAGLVSSRYSVAAAGEVQP